MIQYLLTTTLHPAEVLVLPFFEDGDFQKNIQPLSTLNFESVLSLIATQDFVGKLGTVQFAYTGEDEMPRILLLGLGKKSEFTRRNCKAVFGAATIACQNKKITDVALLLNQDLLDIWGAEQLLQEIVVGVERANYSYDMHKQKDTRVVSLTDWQFVVSDFGKEKKEMQKGIEEGTLIAESLNWARTLGNTPPSIMTPGLLASEAQTIAQKNPLVKVKIFSQKEIEKLKMGCLLGVAQGSIHEPKFIVVEYFGGKQKDAPTVFVGKGITFDSGGLSLKPADALMDMKYDMLGGATVLGIIRAAAALGIKKNIVALVPTCENMPSGSSYRPDDILTAMDGKTILVENTDAEGRLILADALCYAAKYNPKEVIDMATLTGHCCFALGNERSGLFTQHESLAQKLQNTSANVGEHLWRLPLGEEYTEAIKCEVADLRNLGGVGSPRYGCASTAAALLESFTSYPWAHIDMSCSHYNGKGKAWIRGGANGFGVETFVEFLKS